MNATEATRNAKRSQMAQTLLRDAGETALSEGSRIKAAFDAGYLVALNAAGHGGANHPDKESLVSGAMALHLSEVDAQLGLRLLGWAERPYFEEAPLSVEAAIQWAERMVRAGERIAQSYSR